MESQRQKSQRQESQGNKSQEDKRSPEGQECERQKNQYIVNSLNSSTLYLIQCSAKLIAIHFLLKCVCDHYTSWRLLGEGF